MSHLHVAVKHGLDQAVFCSRDATVRQDALYRLFFRECLAIEDVFAVMLAINRLSAGLILRPRYSRKKRMRSVALLS